MLKFILLATFSSLTFAGSFGIVQDSYSYKDTPEFKAILAALAPYGEFSVKTKLENPTPSPEKTLSKGEMAVEAAKAKNRALIAAQRKEESVQVEKDDSSTLQKWKREEKETLNRWKKETQDELKRWKKDQDIFLGRIKIYQENTFELPIPKEKIVEKKVELERIPDVHIVSGTFQVPIRDQWNRPTCAAFAGARLLEILLAQNKQTYDLSEQYLYWASKPQCHSAPCASRGSWIVPGYRFSQKQTVLDIPVEGNCRYLGETLPGNETQLPLKSGCSEGSAKVERFEEVKTLLEMVELLKKNTPVVMAAKLSPNFYKNQGLVTLTDAQKPTAEKMDKHSLGHAFVGVGLIELPEKLKSSEGNFCVVVANSWGKGWGAGGYSCLTENWLLKYRQPSAFVAVTKVSVK